MGKFTQADQILSNTCILRSRNTTNRYYTRSVQILVEDVTNGDCKVAMRVLLTYYQMQKHEENSTDTIEICYGSISVLFLFPK
jgi:exo-beta-1,3-glucanase (GH17 family)